MSQSKKAMWLPTVSLRGYDWYQIRLEWLAFSLMHADVNTGSHICSCCCLEDMPAHSGPLDTLSLSLISGRIFIASSSR